MALVRTSRRNGGCLVLRWYRNVAAWGREGVRSKNYTTPTPLCIVSVRIPPSGVSSVTRYRGSLRRFSESPTRGDKEPQPFPRVFMSKQRHHSSPDFVFDLSQKESDGRYELKIGLIY
jgi:hypothetical protein